MNSGHSRETLVPPSAIERLELEEAARNARQLDPFRRVGLENALAVVGAEHAYRKVNEFVAQEAGALGLTLADLDNTPSFLP